MSLANDTNAPIRYKGKRYKALSLEDITELIESLPKRLVPRQLLPFVAVTDALKFARSPYGLPELMRIVSEKSGHTHAHDLAISEKLELAGALTDRFYGFDALLEDPDDEPDDSDDEPPQAFQEGPAS